MVVLLQIRERIRQFYFKYDNFVVPVMKFLLALIALITINKSLGYSAMLKSAPVTMVLALFCSFLPLNFIALLSVGVVLLHLYALSLESVIVAASVFFLMFLLYFRFSPGDTVLLVMTPICFVLKIPYVIPIAAGLLGTPTSMASSGCGVIAFFVLKNIRNSASLMASNPDTETLVEKFRYLIDALLGNKEMVVFVAAFAVTILAVYLIRRLKVDNSWNIAIATGALIDILILLAGDLKFKLYLSVAGIIIGTVFAVLVAVVIKFFVFNVDYSRTERVQFEDEEYYYYVKAVPKNSVQVSAPKVKKIKGNVPESAEKETRVKRSSLRTEKKDAPEYHMHRSVTGKETSVSRIEREVASRAKESRERRRNS